MDVYRLLEIHSCIRLPNLKRKCFIKNHYLLMSIDFLMTVFIREAQVEENNSSECIRTVAATYGCKILRLIHM